MFLQSYSSGEQMQLHQKGIAARIFRLLNNICTERCILTRISSKPICECGSKNVQKFLLAYNLLPLFFLFNVLEYVLSKSMTTICLKLSGLAM